MGGVRKWQFLMIYSTVNHQRGGWVGLKKLKTWWHNIWMVPKWNHQAFFSKKKFLISCLSFPKMIGIKCCCFENESVIVSIIKLGNCMQDQTGIKIEKNWKCVMLGLLFQQTTTTFWPAILVQKNGWLCLGCSTPVSGQPEFSYLSHSSRQKKNPFTWDIQNKTIPVFLVPIH